jgi:hypothetical protein
LDLSALSDHKSEKAKALSNLAAQRAQALANNDSKTASLIEKIIRLLEKKK